MWSICGLLKNKRDRRLQTTDLRPERLRDAGPFSFPIAMGLYVVGTQIPLGYRIRYPDWGISVRDSSPTFVSSGDQKTNSDFPKAVSEKP